MMKEHVVEAVNRQIQAEFNAAHKYLAMAARFEQMKLRGAAQWMRVQWREEIEHGMKFFEFLIRRGEDPQLRTIEKPDVSFDKAIDAFRMSLENERSVTQMINELYDLAVKEGDYPLQTLLHWFIDEQVEEEEAVEEIIDSLTLAGDTGEGLLMIDRELGQRTAAA
ncbi:MAG: ferritin [Rhodothermales bacterium]|nr:ferritin [Rhodothermales bacterium]